MSRSDSDIPEDNGNRKNLRAGFKAKFRCKLPYKHKFRSKVIGHQLRPLLLEYKLFTYINTNNVEAVHHLLDIGVSANTSDFQNRSALHIAVSKGYKDVVKLLLEFGADPNSRDMIENTPLHLAVCSHNFAIISLLIDAGADVNSLDMHGRHPLGLAKSKMQILQKSWMSGLIESIKLKAELKEVIDLLISVQNAKRKTSNESSTLNTSDMLNFTINSLENLKVTINSNESKNMDDQISQLLVSLEGFQIGVTEKKKE